jgi:mono/diheme cytochrome c family protein
MKQSAFLSILIIVLCLSACSSPEKAAGPGSTPALAARANNEGKTLSNPVPATPASISSGKKLFDKLCAECHGEKADGVSAIAAAMPEGELKPPNLTDDKWDHGSTDGDIFVFIRDGAVGSAAMKGLNGRPGVGPNEMWNLVNYVRSLHAAPGTAN